MSRVLVFFGRAVCVRTATSPPPLFGADGSMCIPVIPGCPWERKTSAFVRIPQQQLLEIKAPLGPSLDRIKNATLYESWKTKSGGLNALRPFLANWCQTLHRLQACTTYNGDDSTNSIHNVFSPPPLFFAGPCVFREKRGESFTCIRASHSLSSCSLKRVPIEKQKLVRG